MVNSITEEIGKNTEEGECDGDSLEVRARLVFLLPFWELSSQEQNGNLKGVFKLIQVNAFIRILLCFRMKYMCFLTGL